MRGRGVNSNKAFRGSFVVVKLEQIEENFKAGERVSPKILFDKGLIRKKKGQLPNVKIVNTGELKKKVIFIGVAITKTAQEAIEKAGAIIK